MKLSSIQERFNAVVKQFDEQMQSFVEKRSQFERDLCDARNRFNALLAEDIEKQSKQTSVELAKVKKEIDSLELELSMMTKRIEIVAANKEKALKELFPRLVAERDEAVRQACEAILEACPQLKKQRAELLLFLKSLHEMSVDAREMHRDVESIANTLGIDYHARFSLPSLPLFANQSGVDQNLIALQHEVTDAYFSGKVPYFVAYYGKTRIMTDENTARREMLK